VTDGSMLGRWSVTIRSAMPAPTKWTPRVIDPKADSIAGPSDALADQDDTTLVAAVVAGRREAFDVIVERHQRAVYHVCYRFVGNHEDASDLAQEAFVRAWRGLGQFKGQSALSTWLHRIAVNLCLNRVSLKAPALEPIIDDRFVDEHTEDPRSEVLREERARAVRRAIEALPRKQRATVILRAYQELSHQQIAEILGSSVGAVKANFFHALANLRRALGSEP
jgi:RNA polymerase sigma-70 factor (ECF subfamily)